MPQARRISVDRTSPAGYRATAGAFLDLPKHPNYVIVYRPETVPLQVVAILHGKQDLEKILKDRLAQP